MIHLQAIQWLGLAIIVAGLGTLRLIMRPKR